jgi:hypothetical protein
MHFKREKPKKKKGIEWKTPKYIQKEHEDAISKPSKYWRNKYQCHKSKGDHTFVLTKERNFLTLHWKEFICTACGKKKYECGKKTTVS